MTGEEVRLSVLPMAATSEVKIQFGVKCETQISSPFCLLCTVSLSELQKKKLLKNSSEFTHNFEMEFAFVWHQKKKHERPVRLQKKAISCFTPFFFATVLISIIKWRCLYHGQVQMNSYYFVIVHRNVCRIDILCSFVHWYTFAQLKSFVYCTQPQSIEYCAKNRSKLLVLCNKLKRE